MVAQLVRLRLTLLGNLLKRSAWQIVGFAFAALYGTTVLLTLVAGLFALSVDDAKLSKHLKVLSDAGLTELRKESSPKRIDARRLTWVALTAAGSAALEAHLAALADIANGSPAS